MLELLWSIRHELVLGALPGFFIGVIVGAVVNALLGGDEE